MRRLPVPDPGEPDARSATRYMLWLVRNQRTTIFGGMVFGVLWMVSQALMPAVIGRTIDSGITHRNSGELLRWSAAVLALGAATAASGILRHRNALVNFLAAGYSTVQVVTRHAVRLGATLPKLVAAGDVVAVGTSDVAEIGGGLDVTARLAGAIVAIIAVAVIMLTTSAPLGLIVLVAVPTVTVLTGFLLRPLHERQQHFRVRQGELTARAIDIAAGLRVLRGIGGEAAFAKRYRRESQELRAVAVAVTRVESGLAAVEVLMPGVIVAGVTFLAARFALDGKLTVGELVAFYGYAAFLATPLRTLMEAADCMTRAHVAAGRVVRILNLSPEISDPEGPAERALPTNAPLADGASGLWIAPGSLFAVVCADPSDADSLAARLARFEDSGAPTLGGVPLTAVPVTEVRKRILLARNSDRFFTGTLRDELDSGGRATDCEIGAAIDMASARDVVEALAEGLATEVVDGGRTFSGGQLQRLRLARALLAKREITLLVEPTSAVDAHTEARIAENLAVLHAGGGAPPLANGVQSVQRAERLPQRDERLEAELVGQAAGAFAHAAIPNHTPMTPASTASAHSGDTVVDAGLSAMSGDLNSAGEASLAGSATMANSPVSVSRNAVTASVMESAVGVSHFAGTEAAPATSTGVMGSAGADGPTSAAALPSTALPSTALPSTALPSGADGAAASPVAAVTTSPLGSVAPLRTTVVFTTSPLLLDRAHSVAYVEGGRVAAVGTHRDLLLSEPRYAAVVTRGEDE